MKVLLLAGGRKGVHTIRWANGLASRGVDVHVVTQQSLIGNIDTRVQVHNLPYRGLKGYVLNVPALRSLIRRLKPDVVHAHYASGYGTLARFARVSPLLLSVWGSDVYDFPQRSVIHRHLVKRNLQYADEVASISRSMAGHIESNLNYSRKCLITPWGIDTDFFKPAPTRRKIADDLVIGTVKGLSNKYGIDTLIRAFGRVKEAVGERYRLRLEIAGDGPRAADLRRLAEQLGLGEDVVFHGFVGREQVRSILQGMDIYVALSRLDSESFGVALLEASACELPLVVSNVSGPSEVVIDKSTGFIVPKDDVEAASKMILALVENQELRREMGIAGRQHVIDNYTWDESLDIMLNAYNYTICK